MSEVAIRVDGLSKRYSLGRPVGYRTLRDSLTGIAKAPLQLFRRGLRQPAPAFWALNDVSFEIKHGEVIGIIGRNGAGKSTLLKILSRITEPTKGRADIWGRVGSLLEVGTGFHPELSGRENLYMNGAILGMRRAEISRKFDEIVAFAEIEQFIDTPVKHYSSGMYTRLAFAVAAHLEPEILVVDEVLAVGDAGFQKKCLGKMQDVAQQGRTVLFVSHSMAAIQNLCQRGILLDGGRVSYQGDIDSTIHRYIQTLRDHKVVDLRSYPNRSGRGRVRFTGMRLETESGETVEHGVSGETLVIALDYESSEQTIRLQDCATSIVFSDSIGQVLFNCWTRQTSKETMSLPPAGTIRCVIPELPLTQSEYLLTLFLQVNGDIEDFIVNGVTASVVDGDFFGTSVLYPVGWQGKGVLVKHAWRVEERR